MSIDLIVHLQRASMPRPTEWQEAIRAAGFPVEIDLNFDAHTFAGFLPCSVDGRASGFEYHSSSLSPSQALELEAPPGSDFSVTLVSGSEIRELAAAIVAASVLCGLSRGQLVDPQADESWSGQAAVEWAKAEFANLKPELT